MTRAHWPDVQAIYARGVREGNATFEEDVPEWEAWDVAHHPHSRLVALDGERVIGWAALSPVSRRACYAGVAEVSVYVASDSRAMGVGSALLGALVESAERHGIWTLQASVFPENDATRRLHARHGFRELGQRERVARHRGRWRNTLLLERRSGTVGVD